MVKSVDEKKARTVLVVEDDEFLLKAYNIKLKKEGFEVWLARDGKEAIAYLKKDPPDIVLLDLMLPYLNGFEVLEQIKATAQWKQIPVIITTNLGQDQDIERGKKLGATDYLIKSDVKINDIVKKINNYLK
ncbi:MAG: hypothetical protein A3J48_00990 [Candidatus Doudnabacteria bacterium RIFCSPHIGHO2_02_FULL_46_11]|uniref:Response regulatory domain-containing protein n=1 Tax=Candidatus Doudnabacteria bacterium RIFCSPHIGHO2_02_FULL_46_11 TaxID=1817832 RepID=A0A1F5P7H7_9BACT|nr:MAG: hypothetical protein A3J48_00990 [Candidatus Doudnabacteria bacterium RIFCSPHIGHO2_02_FULL_46_11]